MVPKSRTHIEDRVLEFFNDNRKNIPSWKEDKLYQLCVQEGKLLYHELHENESKKIKFSSPVDCTVFRAESGEEFQKSLPSRFCDGKLFDDEPGWSFFEEKMADSIENIFARIVGAINDDESTLLSDKSYSGRLAIPLFKYTDEHPGLVIRKIRTNTFTLLIRLMCASRIEEKKFVRDIEMSIDIEDINDSKAIKEQVNEKLTRMAEDGAFDVTFDIKDMDMKVTGFTIDVQTLHKSGIELMNGGNKKKQPWKSFQEDREIISDISSRPDYCIANSNTVEMIRLMVILYVCKAIEAYNNIYSEYKKGSFKPITDNSEDEENAVAEIDRYLKENGEHEYLSLQSVVLDAKDLDLDIFHKISSWYLDLYVYPNNNNKAYIPNPDSARKLNMLIKQMHDTGRIFTNEDFYQKLLSAGRLSID